MKKQKVRCFLFYVESNGLYNNEVYLPNNGGWAAYELAICINCGELFVIDRENPVLSYLTLEDISKGNVCPTCKSPLEKTIKPYPLYFLTKKGEIGTFSPQRSLPDDQESKIIEVWELKKHK